MGKIDEVKEILTSLRVAFSVIIGLLVIVVGVLINKEKASDTDIYFWIGLIFVLLLSMGLVYVVKSIVKHIKEIKEIE
jgi:ABC-type polysaccharide/polyol phosphate export permease